MQQADSKTRHTAGKVDSITLASPSILSFFLSNKEIYQVDKIDKKKKEDRHRWVKNFGEHIKNNNNKYSWIELYIVHSIYGDKVPVKVHNKDRDNYRLELAGIQNYGTKQTDFLRIYQEIEKSQLDATIKRIDIAMDFHHRIPHKAILTLNKQRPFKTKYAKTTYYDRSKNKNGEIIKSAIKILIYDKSEKENLSETDKKIMRLEFSFPASFFQGIINKNTKKLTIKDLAFAISKMEKYIKNMTSLNVKIDISFSKLLLEKYHTEYDEDSENTNNIDTSTECKSQNASEKYINQNNAMMNKLINIENKINTFSLEIKKFNLEIKKLEITTKQKYLTLPHLAKFFDYSPSYFEKRKRKNIFKEGIHYFKPPGESSCRWDVETMDKWFRSQDHSYLESEVPKDLDDLINRTVK